MENIYLLNLIYFIKEVQEKMGNVPIKLEDLHREFNNLPICDMGHGKDREPGTPYYFDYKSALEAHLLEYERAFYCYSNKASVTNAFKRLGELNFGSLTCSPFMGELQQDGVTMEKTNNIELNFLGGLTLKLRFSNLMYITNVKSHSPIYYKNIRLNQIYIENIEVIKNPKKPKRPFINFGIDWQELNLTLSEWTLTDMDTNHLALDLDSLFDTKFTKLHISFAPNRWVELRKSNDNSSQKECINSNNFIDDLSGNGTVSLPRKYQIETPIEEKVPHLINRYPQLKPLKNEVHYLIYRVNQCSTWHELEILFGGDVNTLTFSHKLPYKACESDLAEAFTQLLAKDLIERQMELNFQYIKSRVLKKLENFYNII